MREIKFRTPHFKLNGSFTQFTYWGTSAHGYFTGPSYVSGETVEFGWHQQYTGFKDKNGKEIYEGDIIRIHDCECTGHDENESEIWEPCEGNVLFEDGMFVFEGHSAGTLPMSAYKDNFEVIGNIYENPELL